MKSSIYLVPLLVALLLDILDLIFYLFAVKVTNLSARSEAKRARQKEHTSPLE